MIRHPEKIKKFNPTTIKKPNWLKVKAPTSKKYFETLDIVKSHNLVTVCQEAACPNIGECWEKKHATFMILGDTCTRACAFCNVKTGKPSEPPDPMEPLNVASVQCPTLVLCPSSVLMHWNNEIKTYFPNKLIPVPFENGWTKKVRKQIKKEKNNSKAVFLMSYGLFRSRYVSLNSIISHWYYVILDEGHIISNILSLIHI